MTWWSNIKRTYVAYNITLLNSVAHRLNAALGLVWYDGVTQSVRETRGLYEFCQTCWSYCRYFVWVYLLFESTAGPRGVCLMITTTFHRIGILQDQKIQSLNATYYTVKLCQTWMQDGHCAHAGCQRAREERAGNPTYIYTTHKHTRTHTHTHTHAHTHTYQHTHTHTHTYTRTRTHTHTHTHTHIGGPAEGTDRGARERPF
jgi:hypothetical protein